MTADPSLDAAARAVETARVPVRHHVFSTFGGYGVFKTSEDLEPEVQEALDQLVAPLAGAASAEPLLSVFPVGRYVALSSSFVLGRDHAGRPRSVAHTLLVDRALASALPWFVPLRANRSIFLGPEAARGGIGATLVPEVPLELLCPKIDPREVREAALLPGAPALLAALATRRSRAAVVGDPTQVLERLGALSALVPASRRCDVAVLAGSSDGAEHEAAAVVLVVRSLADLNDREGLARINAADGRLEGKLVMGVASFAISAFVEDLDPHAIEALEATFARWSEDEAVPGAPSGPAPPRAFVRAFAMLRPFVRPGGVIELEARAWPSVAAAIPAAAEGSARGLAAALLKDGFERARSTRDPNAVRAILRTIRESVAAAALPQEARSFLAAEVAAAVRSLHEGKGRLGGWKGCGPEAVAGIAVEAETLLASLTAEER